MAFWRRSGFRLAAVLLAAVVCGDVTLDAACDRVVLPGPARAAAVSLAEATGDDAGADSCRPDCFCCSRSEAPGPVLVVPPPTLLSASAPAGPAAAPEGVRPVPELPPLPLA
jgi:hypothetical protein